MKKDYARSPEHLAGATGAGSGGPVRFTVRDSSPASPQTDTCAAHRVLLVEDQADIAQATALGLELVGATVCIAATGNAALELAPQFQPSLVLLDIDLPDISGHEVGRRLGQMPEMANVTLVALTSWNTAEMRQRSADAGLAEHLIKPLTFEALTALLARIPLRA